MAFPNEIYGSYGDERVTSSAKYESIPLGTRMHLPDGRVYAYAKVSATAGVAGQLYQQDAGIGATDAEYVKGLAVVAGSVGSTLVQYTTGDTTAVTANQFQDGLMFVAEASGEGHAYRIKSNPAAASASVTGDIALYKDDPLKVVLAAGTTTIGLIENEFSELSVTTANTVATGPIAGVLPVAVTASYYCWVQRRGPAAVRTDNTTLIVGIPVTASSTVAGQVGVLNITAVNTGGNMVYKGNDPIGYCMAVAASSENSLVYLTID